MWRHSGPQRLGGHLASSGARGGGGGAPVGCAGEPMRIAHVDSTRTGSSRVQCESVSARVKWDAADAPESRALRYPYTHTAQARQGSHTWLATHNSAYDTRDTSTGLDASALHRQRHSWRRPGEPAGRRTALSAAHRIADALGSDNGTGALPVRHVSASGEHERARGSDPARVEPLTAQTEKRRRRPAASSVRYRHPSSPPCCRSPRPSCC